MSNSTEFLSPNYRITFLEIKADTLVYNLPDSNLLADSEKIFSDSLLLEKDIDYYIDYHSGLISFISLHKLSQSVAIYYYIIPDFLNKKVFLYEIHAIRDSLKTYEVIKRNSLLSIDENKLVIKGSKSFSISFSNQESYDLKQSLYLSLNGELGNNMFLEGTLSDSESPLTPEGDSREISSLDQVYLKLYGKQYALIFGDQEYEFTDTELMKYKTKFEGINFWYNNNWGVQGAYAVNGGKQKTNIIQGIEGKQGPYYLNTGLNAQSVLVIAGSERVSINGSIQDRGKDYSIDYSEGSLTFKTLITSNSRIIVDFQYSDDYYRQNQIISSSQISLSPNMSISQHLIKQTDDKNNPLQWSFSEADLDSLENSGDNSVWGQGIIEVEPGSGQYIRKSDANNYTYYEYALNDSTANYLIYFSYIGIGLGDYEPIGSNIYKYVGQGIGSWMPYKRLTAPTDKTNLGINFNYCNDLLDVQTEGLYTSSDNNTFSNKDDDNNEGFIAYNKVNLHPVDYYLNPILSLSYLHRTNNTYTFTNITPEREAYEFINIPETDSIAQDQYDLSVRLNSKDYWNQEFSVRYKTVLNNYDQRTIKNNTQLSQTGLIPSINWYAIYSRFTFEDSVLTAFDKHYHNAESNWKWKKLTLKSRFFFQRDDYKYNTSDNIPRLSSMLYRIINPEIIVSDDNIYSSSISYSDELNTQKIIEWNKLQTSTTLKYEQLLTKGNNSVNLKVIHREVEKQKQDSLYSKKQTYDLLDFKSSHQIWDNTLSLISSYQINQLEFYPKIRELQYIGSGMGIYDSTGIQVIDGDYDYVYINNGQSSLSSEINANLSIFYHLSKKYNPDSIWHRFNVDSYLQLTENAPQNNDYRFYLMFPNKIFKQGTTIYGRQSMQHSIWVDIRRNVLTGNIRYDLSKTLDNRYQTLSNVFSDNKEFELNWKNVYGNQIRNVYKNSLERDSRYQSEIYKNEFSSILYRNISASVNSQLTLEYSLEKGNSDSQNTEYTISSIKVLPSLSWFYKNKYRLTSNFLAQFNKRSGSDLFTFLSDKRAGSIYTWSLQAQYKINSFTSGSIQYSGNSYPKEDTLHEFKMEFRAEL